MAETVAESLSDELFKLLQQERFLLLGTIDHESGAPATNAISWVYAPSPKRILFALDNRSRIVTNIRKEPRVVLTLIGAGSSYAISGEAVVVEERMADVPLKLCKLEMTIHSVRDVMFYGSRISVEPKYEKTYDRQAAAKLDGQVMSALRR